VVAKLPALSHICLFACLFVCLLLECWNVCLSLVKRERKGVKREESPCHGAVETFSLRRYSDAYPCISFLHSVCVSIFFLFHLYFRIYSVSHHHNWRLTN